MFKHSSSTPRTLLIRFSLYLALVACLVWLSLWIFRGAGVPLSRSQVVEATNAAEVSGGQQETSEVRKGSSPQQQQLSASRRVSIWSKRAKVNRYCKL